jgi:serine/threonine-protein kinase
LPVFIGRNAEESIDVVLYREHEIPEGFLQIPGGAFIYQGDRESPYSGPKELRVTEDCFLARVPVRCRDYLEFLNDLSGSGEGAAEGLGPPEKRVPRKTVTSGFYWPRDEAGRWVLPEEAWAAEAPEGLRARASKLENAPGWWEAEWPVLGISWDDLIAFAFRRTRREGFLFGLPHEAQREKAARGPDGRFYPWGNGFDATFANCHPSHEAGPRPSPVGAFPTDESPYGVRGLSGNCREFCLNDPEEGRAGMRVCRGGNWSGYGPAFRSASRAGYSHVNVDYHLGGRLAWFPRCPTGSRIATRRGCEG